jgi:hypothetical protein
MAKCCRYAFYSLGRGWKISQCGLHDKPTTRSQCLRCKERDPGDLDIIDIMNLPKNVGDILLAQMFEFENVRFTQHVTVKVSEKFKSIKVLPLLLSKDDSELLAELLKVCTIKKEAKGEMFLIYRGTERIYTPATGSFHFNSRNYLSTKLQVVNHQSYPPL